MSKVILSLLYLGAVSYVTYRVVQNALREPPVTNKRMSYGTDEDGKPIYDDDMDVDATLELWKEQNRLIRASM